MRARLAIVIAVSLGLVAAIASCSLPKADVGSGFAAFVDDYLDALHRRRPYSAAATGIHRYDDGLEDYSQRAIAAEIVEIHAFQERLASIDCGVLSPSDAVDCQLLESNMEARLLDLEVVRSWERNPQIYGDAVSNGLLWLSLCPSETPAARLGHAIAKLEKVPQLMAAACTNVTNPSPELLEAGIDSITGAIDSIDDDLKSFDGVGDPAIRTRLDAAHAAAVDALKNAAKQFEAMRGHATGSFALGREAFESKLRLEEGLDVSSDRLLALAEGELAAAQRRFLALAHAVDPDRDPRAVWTEIKHEHPAAGQLVAEAQSQLDRIVTFIRDHDIVTIPPSDPIRVQPTPAFMRWSSASAWTPGPAEPRALPATYYITDVDPNASLADQEKHLLDMNRYQLWYTSIHEAYPGHFVQGIWLRRVASKVRRDGAFAPGTYVEGWAHYTEQMMLEEGFGAEDPKMRLGQLAEALLRLCRFNVAIRMHVKGMPLAEATRFFMDNGFLEEPIARAEAMRGTFDPGYLVYTVGKLEILKLREDVKRARGSAFSLRAFHDELLRNGQAPLSLHRQMMLPGNRESILDGI
ncbi:MAG: DUF885 domain-containing protein [Planctomycetes bacterium]|nr:DUF885 domain-containing protein [Planctomycetota bacterium]MBI3846997.1 DUF885 domain-containing protein [Planctomycetota bacterium]